VVSKLFLDKNLITTGFPEYAKDIQMDGFLWGASRNGQTGRIGSNFDGRIDEISLWAKAFSEQEIKQEYHQGYPFYQSFAPELVKNEINNFYSSGLPAYDLNDLTLASNSIAD